MRRFAPNTLISQPEHFSRCDFRDCSSFCSVGHVDIFSSVGLSENRQAGTITIILTVDIDTFVQFTIPGLADLGI